MSETSLPATLGNTFNLTESAFALHDISKFENQLQQSGTSIQSNPFNDSVSSAFSEIASAKANYSTTPKKETDSLNNNNNNNYNNSNNISGMFSSYSTTALSKNDSANGVGPLKQDFNNGTKNPFAASERNNTWNELNALDLNQLRFELSNDENQTSIFANVATTQDQKPEVKKEIPVDLFKDMTSSLFNEFSSPRHKNNEFFNKITGFDCVRT